MTVDTPTTILKLRDQGPGNNPTTWGEIQDTNNQILEVNSSGMVTVDVTGSVDITLTNANYTIDQGKYGMVKLTGAIGANINLIIPSATRKLIIWNTATGNFTITVKTSGGTGIVVPRLARSFLLCDGTDTYNVASSTDYIGGDIPSTRDQDYVFVYLLPYAGTITQSEVLCDSGTATAVMKINSTALGGGAQSVSNVSNTVAHTTNNAFVRGDKYVVTISNSALCTNFRFSARFERSTL